MTVTLNSTRFGTVQIEPEAVLEFPRGLIGLGGSRYALLTTSPDSPFSWLHSLDDPALALPVTRPWAFFPDYEVVLGDADQAALGVESADGADVWVTVRAAGRPEDFTANLRAPIVVAAGQALQVINEASSAPVRAPLLPDS